MKKIGFLFAIMAASAAIADTQDYINADVILIKGNIAYFSVGEADGVSAGEQFEIYYDQRIVADGLIGWADRNISRSEPLDSSMAAGISYYHPLSARIKLYVAQANRGGFLNIAIFSDLDLQPSEITTPEDMMVGRLIHRGLLTRNKKNEIIPDLCGDYEIQDLTYTFYISPDAYFHNGKTIEAQDVVYSFEQLASSPILTNSSCFVLEINGADEYRSRLKNEIAGMFIIDKKTLAITLKRPFPAFEEYLAGPGGYIIPQPAEVTTATEIGAGPYRIKWRDISGTVLEPFSDIGDAAYLDSLRFVKFTSVDEAGLAFELGRLDVINLLGESSPKFVTKGNYTSYNSNTSVYAILGFNNSHSFQIDRNFSKALSFLLDRDSIIRVLLGNAAAKPVFENSDERKTSLQLYGLFFPDSVDYYLSQMTTHPQILTLYVDGNYPILSKVARYIEGQLQSKGIKIKELEFDSRSLTREQAKADVDMYITFDVPSAANPDCIFYPLLCYSLSDQTNFLYFKDEATQNFLDNLRTETDPDRRESLALGLAQTSTIDPPALFLYQPFLTTITKLDISGTAINPSGYIDFRRAFIEISR